MNVRLLIGSKLVGFLYGESKTWRLRGNLDGIFKGGCSGGKCTFELIELAKQTCGGVKIPVQLEG
jgi:hypothetical protein